MITDKTLEHNHFCESQFFDKVSDFNKKEKTLTQSLFSLSKTSYSKTRLLYSRLVKWTSLVLSIFSFLFLLPGTIPLIVTFIFPILGFIGAHKYNALIAKFYTVYLVLITIEQIIVMGIFPNPAYIVLQCFVMVAEIIVLLYNIKFTKEILILSDLDLLTLKTGKSS